MGNEAIPPMANLYLYVKEKHFVEKRIRELGHQEVLRRTQGYKTVLRFIDDRISPAFDISDLPGDEEYGMEILCTGQGTTVSYLGLQVDCSDPQQVVFKAQDKQQKFQFTLTRFPSWHTCVPSSTRIGTVVGMLVRTLRLTTKVADFFAEVTSVVSLFQQRGYTVTDMKKAFGKFTVRHIHERYRNHVLVSLLDFLKSWKDPVPISILGVRSDPQVPSETPPNAVVEAESPPQPPPHAPSPPPSSGVGSLTTPTRMVLRSHTQANTNALRVTAKAATAVVPRTTARREIAIEQRTTKRSARLQAARALATETARTTTEEPSTVVTEETQRSTQPSQSTCTFEDIVLHAKTRTSRPAAKRLRASNQALFDLQIDQLVTVTETKPAGDDPNVTTKIHQCRVVNRFDGNHITVRNHRGEVIFLPSQGYTITNIQLGV